MGARRNPASARVLALTANDADILFIGDVQPFLDAHPDLRTGRGQVFASFEDLTADLLSEAEPDIIVSPLVGPRFDAAEVAEILDDLGYEGRYVVVAPPLPQPDIIRGDLSAAAPGLELEVRVPLRN